MGINPTRRGAELARDVTHTDCQLVVTEAASAPAIAGLDLGLDDDRVLDTDGDAYATLLATHDGAGPPDVAIAEDDRYLLLFTSGTSGALYLMNMALLSPGDEIIIPDPYFVAYPSMAKLAQGRAVRCDTYPDFRMTADRIEPLINERTKAVLLNSPGNPTGVVLTQAECNQILELCRSKGVLLVSDEIYSEFTFKDAASETPVGLRAPSPASVAGSHEDVLMIRGFGKSFGCTGWRMGFVAGPEVIVREMTKIQQYSYVCAPAPLQHGCLAAYGLDIEGLVDTYRKRRDMVVEALGEVTEVFAPGGAFYCFVKIPEKLNITSQEFFEKAVERNVLIIPGNVFSSKDTHFRVSMAAPEAKLEAGIAILKELLGGGAA